MKFSSVFNGFWLTVAAFLLDFGVLCKHFGTVTQCSVDPTVPVLLTAKMINNRLRLRSLGLSRSFCIPINMFGLILKSDLRWTPGFLHPSFCTPYFGPNFFKVPEPKKYQVYQIFLISGCRSTGRVEDGQKIDKNFWREYKQQNNNS